MVPARHVNGGWFNGNRLVHGSAFTKYSWLNYASVDNSTWSAPSLTAPQCVPCLLEKTGPSSLDRRKLGSKHHLITEQKGIPLAVILTSADSHDVTQLLPMVQAIPAIAGKRGRPLRKSKILQGDRGYDSELRSLPMKAAKSW